MAMGGLKPVVAIYSTFFSRAFDQAHLDVGLLNLPVVFVFDRAGVTGDDGPSHHGLLDIALCLAIPNMTVFAPSTAEEVPGMLATALSMSSPTALRFPKTLPKPFDGKVGDGLEAREVRRGDGSLCVLAVGKMAPTAYKALELMGDEAAQVTLYDVRVLPPGRLDDRRRAEPRTSGERRRRHPTRGRRDPHGVVTAQPSPGPRPTISHHADPRDPARVSRTTPTRPPPGRVGPRPRGTDGRVQATARRRARVRAGPPRGTASRTFTSAAIRIRSRYIDAVGFDVEKPDEEWRTLLSEDRYAVLRRVVPPEIPWTGSLLHASTPTVYFSCGGCGQHLFTSEQKFDSGCGWPSFDSSASPAPSSSVPMSLARRSAREPRSSARSAVATWVTSSMTDRRRRGCATA